MTRGNFAAQTSWPPFPLTWQWLRAHGRVVWISGDAVVNHAMEGARDDAPVWTTVGSWAWRRDGQHLLTGYCSSLLQIWHSSLVKQLSQSFPAARETVENFAHLPCIKWPYPDSNFHIWHGFIRMFVKNLIYMICLGNSRTFMLGYSWKSILQLPTYLATYSCLLYCTHTVQL